MRPCNDATQMKKATVCLVLLAALAGGCVTKVETMELPHPETPPGAITSSQTQTVMDKRVVIDPALEGSIRVVRIKAESGSNGFLKIQLNLQNMTDSPKEFFYRMDWFEKDGTPLPMASATTPWMLLKGETSFLAATAPTPAARDFCVTFVAARK